MVCSKFVKRENIHEISSKIKDKFTVENHEICLLSLDLDGVDYWIWDALEDIDPRVVVVEYYNVLGMESVTILSKRISTGLMSRRITLVHSYLLLLSW